MGKRMDRNKMPTSSKVILQKAGSELVGVPEISKRTGIPVGTIYLHIRNGGWPLAEIRAIDKMLHFTNEELAKIVRG